MPLAAAFAKFTVDAAQCDSLLGTAHHQDAAGAYLFPPADRSLITQAAFLNLFIAWEGFLEEAFSRFMVGSPTTSGVQPVKYVSPPTTEAAKSMIIGNSKYFDYANIDFVRKLAALYFQNGYPFEPHLSASQSDISDMRTMRNASAHISSTTQRALEGLAQRILSVPAPGITLYALLTTVDPNSAGGTIIFQTYRDKLLVAAELIARG